MYMRQSNCLTFVQKCINLQFPPLVGGASVQSFPRMMIDPVYLFWRAVHVSIKSFRNQFDSLPVRSSSRPALWQKGAAPSGIKHYICFIESMFWSFKKKFFVDLYFVVFVLFFFPILLIQKRIQLWLYDCDTIRTVTPLIKMMLPPPFLMFIFFNFCKLV